MSEGTDDRYGGETKGTLGGAHLDRSPQGRGEPGDESGKNGLDFSACPSKRRKPKGDTKVGVAEREGKQAKQYTSEGQFTLSVVSNPFVLLFRRGRGAILAKI